MAATIRDRLRVRLAGPDAEDYRSVEQTLARLQMDTCPSTVEGAQHALLDLVQAARAIKHADDAHERLWAAQELKTHGRRCRPDPTAVISDPARALQRLLVELYPQQLPVGVADMAAVLDGMVGRLAYRQMPEDENTQQVLVTTVTTEARRVGVLPAKRSEAAAFVEELVAYINDSRE